MKHSYFSIFSVVEIIIELLVVCQELIHVHNFCSSCYRKFKVTNLAL